MKKIIKTSLFLAALLSASIMTTNAKTMTAEQLNNLVTIKVGSQNLSQNLYIYGKYVFVNTITSAELNDAMNDLLDDVDYAKSYRELFKDNVAALIHKDSNNNWENLTYGGSLAKKASIEMTHLIGDLTGEHISNADVYDGTYIKQEKLPSNRTAEIFVDQMAKLNIADIRATDGKGTLASPISTDTHAHNTKALEVNFSKNILKLNEKMPLLKYNNGTDNAKWVGLVIKTNKALTKNDRITINGTNYTTEETGIKKLVSASEHGGDVSDYIIWLDADTLKNNPSITVSVKNNNGSYEIVQTIKLEYTAIKASFTDEIAATEEGSIPSVTTNRDSMSSAIAKIVDKYVVLFYTDDTQITQVEYTINGDKKVASKNSAYNWSKTDLLQVLGTEKATITTPNDNQKWNQNAITSINAPEVHSNTEEEPYDYVVRIHHNKGLKDLENTGVTVNIDLSVGAGYISGYNNVSDSTKWTVKLTKEETIIDFINSKINDNKDKVSVKFILVDETPEMSIDVTKGAEVDLYRNPNQTQSGINGNYKFNLQNVDLTFKKSDKGYETIIQQIDMEKPLAKFNATQANATSGKSYIGVIVDFGDVSISDITAETLSGDTATTLTLDKAKNIDNAQYYGAKNNNSIVLWISESQTIRFTNNETNSSVIVYFDFRTMKSTYVVDKDTDATRVTNVVIDPKYADQVQYVAGHGFIVNEGITKFVAKTTITDSKDSSKSTTAEYTYVITGTNAKKVQNLNLTKVYAVEFDRKEELQYSLDSIKEVSFNGNVINVVFNKNVNDNFALALNLGLGTSGITEIFLADETGEKTGNAVEKVSENRFKNTVPTDLNELNLIWVNPNITSKEKGQEFKLVHYTASGTSVVYTIVIKSTVENEQPELELKSEEKVVVDSNKLETEIYNKMKNNFEATSVRKEDNKVIISYIKELTKYANDDDSTEAHWFGVLVDLGVNPAYLEADCWEIKPADYQDVVKFGGKDNSTQFVMWFSKENFDVYGKDETDEYGEKTGRKVITIKFSNKEDSTDKYAEPITLEFILEDAREKLELKSIEELSTNTSAKVNDLELFKLNQERFESSYDFENNTITVRPTLEDNEFVSYTLDKEIDAKETSASWYAVEVDFGKNVSLKWPYENVKLQKVEGSTKGILWFNSKAYSNTAIFIDDYNGMEYTMTFKLDK